MTQVTSGLRAILSIPWVYGLFQRLMGENHYKRKFVAEFIDPFNVNSVLDIGCGTAAILAFLPDIEYYGYDISQAYIRNAKSRYGDKALFFNREFNAAELEHLPKFDLVLMHGLLHHLDDAQAMKLITTAYQALKVGGRLITADGCLVNGQNPLAKWLIKHDRGKNIKDEAGYRRLVEPTFEQVESLIVHHDWIPYTLCYLHCTR